MADDPRAQIYVIDHVAPGTTIQRQFEVANGDPEPFDIEAYSVLAEIEDGQFIGDDGRQQNDLASWITVTPAEAIIQPGERITAELRVDVPQDAAPGEQYAVVFAERPPEDTGDDVSFAQRVGIRIYLSVGEGNAPASDFEITSFTASRGDEGEPMLDATVENTGGRALDFQGEVSLDDGPADLSAGPFDVALGSTLAPGDTTEVAIPLDSELPDGPWEATLTLRSGLLEKEAVETITFPEAGEANVIEIEPVDEGLSTTALAAGAAAIGGLLVVPLWWIGRRRDDEDEKDETEALEDRESEDGENSGGAGDSNGTDNAEGTDDQDESVVGQDDVPSQTPAAVRKRPRSAPAFPPPVVSAPSAPDRKAPVAPPPPPGASAPVPPAVVPTPTGL